MAAGGSATADAAPSLAHGAIPSSHCSGALFLDAEPTADSRTKQPPTSKHAATRASAKTRGLLTKRRSVVGLAELNNLSDDVVGRGGAGFWFQRRVAARALKPVCQISYQRTARVAMTEYGPMRLTLDDNLRALPAVGLRFSEDEGQLILKDRLILELKFRHGMPGLFKYLVEEFALTPKSFYQLPAEMREIGPSYRAAYPQGVERWAALEALARAPGTRIPIKSGPISLAMIGHLDVPCLLMTGSADLYIPPSHMARLAKAFRRDKLIVIPEAGHAAYWEQPDLFNRNVLDFLRQHRRASFTPSL